MSKWCAILMRIAPGGVVAFGLSFSLVLLPLSDANASSRTTWSVVASPNGSGNVNYLQGVSCMSQNFCVAVGYSTIWTFEGFPTGILSALIEIWNGTTWTVASSNVSGDGVLNSVSCATSNSCIAVGSAGIDEDDTLIDSWNGTSWSVDPISLTQAGALSGVSCVSQDSCTAVGVSSGNTLIETWNGVSWAVAPTNPTQPGGLNAVSCPSQSSCTSVGYQQPSGNFAETWNGTSWSVVPIAADGHLTGVSCVSQSFCMAAGYGSNSSQTLVESWDGTSWSTVPSPNLGFENQLLGVTCIAQDQCTAVGVYWATSRSWAKTLVEYWNGTSWSLMSSANERDANELLSVSCDPRGDACSAVGDNTIGHLGDGLVQNTLTEEGVLPAITSPSSTTVTEGSPFSFPITTLGIPTPKITKQGTLPRGVTFHNNHDGTATISGTATSTRHESALGTFPLTITATVGSGKKKQVVTQAFTLTVT
jgi:hypothetical protein